MWDYPGLVRAEVRPGERLLWGGRPRPGLRLQRSDLATIPFSVFFFGFSLFWFWSASGGGRSISPFSLFGLPFILIGLYMLIGRFFLDAYRRQHTYYGLTDQRLLTVSDAFGRKSTAVSLHNLPSLSLEVGGDGYGTISVGGPPGIPTVFGFSNRDNNQPNVLTLEQVEAARVVYEQIQATSADLERARRQVTAS